MSAISNRPTCRFYVPGSTDSARWMLERRGTATYRVTEQIEYVDHDGYAYRFPLDVNKNTTDFASIPWFLSWLVPRDGRHTPAAIMHDAFIGGKVGVDYSTTKPEGVSDEHADYLFREAMEQAKVGFLRRWMMWAAVSMRTMSVRPNSTKINRVKIGALAILLLGWALMAAVLALDVPDFERSGWHLPWFGDRPWFTEIWHGLVVIGAVSAAFAVLIGAILARRRAPSVGLIAGLIVGFFGLPMVTSAMGWGGYMILDAVVSRIKEGHIPKPLMVPLDDDEDSGKNNGDYGAV